MLHAEVRSGAGYSVEADTLDGGGGLSTSASFSNEGSIESQVVGESIASNYKVIHGFVTGRTLVTGTDSYDTWIGSFGLTGDDALPTADPDKDHLPNAVEMVLGGDPANGMDVALMPTLELVTGPAGLPAGNYLLFTYRRTDRSGAAGLTVICQYDSDLSDPWLSAVSGIDGVLVREDDDFASFIPPAAEPTDRVRVFIPRAGNNTLFGRISVMVP